MRSHARIPLRDSVSAAPVSRLTRLSSLRDPLQTLHPSLMPPNKHRPQIPPRNPRHDPVLTFFSDNPASAAPIRFDKPPVMCLQHTARVPRKFMRRFEHDHLTSNGGPKRLPSKFSIKRKVGRIPANETHIRAVAVPLRPLRRPNKPPPNPLRRRRDRNLIARIHRRILRLKSRHPFHRAD